MKFCVVLGKLNWSNIAYSDVLSILLSTHNQWDGKCHYLWIISMCFNTALDSCIAFLISLLQFIAGPQKLGLLNNVQLLDDNQDSLRERVLMNPAPSVCQSVGEKSSHTSRYQFFLIFCIKLALIKSRKVTFFDFRKKNVLAQKWAIQGQKGAKMRFQAIFLV